MNNLVGKQLGQYTITALLGEGGMAVVYRARQESIKREVAIKIMKTEMVTKENAFIERFVREAQTLASLSHPNIMKIFDYGEFGNSVYLVMELMPGGSLAKLIRQTRGIPVETALKTLTQVGTALDYAHSQGIIHRDLKPDNILFDRNGNAVINDFGLARLTNRSTELTHTGQVMGTPYYMAPEQWRDAMVDSRADIYSLGVILFEMLAGEPPFTADTPMALMFKHVRDDPPTYKLRRVNRPELDPVVMRALAKDPDRRYQTAGSLVNDMARALGETPPIPEAVLTKPLQLVEIKHPRNAFPPETVPAYRTEEDKPDRPRPAKRRNRNDDANPVNPVFAYLVLGVGIIMALGLAIFIIAQATRPPAQPTPLPVIRAATSPAVVASGGTLATTWTPVLTATTRPEKYTFSGLKIETMQRYNYRLDVRYVGRQPNNTPFEGSMQINTTLQGKPYLTQLDIAMRETLPVFRDVLLKNADYAAFPDSLIVTGQSTYLVAEGMLYRMGSAVPVTTRCETSTATNTNLAPIRAVSPTIFLPDTRLRSIELTYNAGEAKYSGAVSTRDGSVPYSETLDVYLASGGDFPTRVIYARKWGNTATAGSLVLTEISVEYRLNNWDDNVNVSSLKAPSVCAR